MTTSASEKELEIGQGICRDVGRVGVREFYFVFPRDDFRLVFEAEPRVFANAALKALKTLSPYVIGISAPRAASSE